MVWIKIDDHFDEHPKMQQIGPLGWGIWLAGLAYCNRNLTDGFIPWSKAHTLAGFQLADDDGTLWDLARTCGMMGDDIDAAWVIGRLVDAGLWEPVENGKGRVDGYRIHDYGDFQPLKATVEAEREKKRQAGQAGGRASAQARAQAPAQPPAEAGAQAESNPVPVPGPAPDEERITLLRPPSEAAPRPPDLLWEAVCGALGVDAHGEGMTGSYRGALNRAVGEIRQAGGAPEEVPRKVAAYRKAYPNASLTGTALAKHWPELGTAQPRSIEALPREWRPKGKGQGNVNAV